MSECPACALCHDEVGIAGTWRGMELCASCLEYASYYDGLTPAERRAENDSIARHVAESRRW